MAVPDIRYTIRNLYKPSFAQIYMFHAKNAPTFCVQRTVSREEVGISEVSDVIECNAKSYLVNYLDLRKAENMTYNSEGVLPLF